MSVHRYPGRTIRRDLMRGLTGVTVFGMPLVLISGLLPVIFWICAAGTCLCAIYIFSAAARGYVEVGIDDRRISRRGVLGESEIPWDRLSGVTLKYFRAGKSGDAEWWRLTLRGDGGTVHLESGLTGFETIVRRGQQAAVENGVQMKDATRENLAAFTEGRSHRPIPESRYA